MRLPLWYEFSCISIIEHFSSIFAITFLLNLCYFIILRCTVYRKDSCLFWDPYKTQKFILWADYRMSECYIKQPLCSNGIEEHILRILELWEQRILPSIVNLIYRCRKLRSKWKYNKNKIQPIRALCRSNLSEIVLFTVVSYTDNTSKNYLTQPIFY